MRALLLGIFAVGIALPVQAQVPIQGQVSTATMPAGIIGSGVSTGAGLNTYGYADNAVLGSFETPTMRRQKMAWAVALHEEAITLRARDGGVLSDHHAREIERKWRAILSHSHAGPGALAPIRD